MADPQAVAATCHYVGFCALKTQDQAAWASAIGSIAAAVVALGIAVSGGVARRFQRRKDGRALAAYLATDVYTVYQALEGAIKYIEKFLYSDDSSGLLQSNLFPFAATTNADLTGAVLEAKVDRFGALPSDIGEELAGAVGSLDACRRAVSKFAAELRQTPPPAWANFCTPILEQLRQTKGNLERTVAYCRVVGRDT